jgi:putative FmdB family regulatory protein
MKGCKEEFMPIYEYRCQSCDKEHEVIQKFSDDPLVTCPDCGGDLNKVISNTSFVLKGSGWYSDGYSSPAPKQEAVMNPEKNPKKTPKKTPEKKTGTDKKAATPSA